MVLSGDTTKNTLRTRKGYSLTKNTHKQTNYIRMTRNSYHHVIERWNGDQPNKPKNTNLTGASTSRRGAAITARTEALYHGASDNDMRSDHDARSERNIWERCTRTRASRGAHETHARPCSSCPHS